MPQIADREVTSFGSWLDERAHNESVPTAQEEAETALQEMQRDVTGHLTKPVLQLLRTPDAGGDDVAGIVLSHLVRCDDCIFRLRQSLEVSGASAGHPAFGLLSDAEEAIRWGAAARTATAAAHRGLVAQGIGYVYERDGVVYRRLPDGEEERIDTADSPAA